MRKVFYLLLVVIFCFSERVSAQRDSVVAYMKSCRNASWLEAEVKIVDTKDSADFVRMVASPDPASIKTCSLLLIII